MLENSDYRTEDLVDSLINAIREKKGENITSLYLDKLDHAVCKYFIICHANSDKQVLAIGENIQDKIKEEFGSILIHREGMKNAHWILFDYFDVIVHVFKEEYRSFYDLEDLWADAERKNYDS